MNMVFFTQPASLYRRTRISWSQFGRLTAILLCWCCFGFFSAASHAQNLFGSQVAALSACQSEISGDQAYYGVYFSGTVVQPCTVSKDPSFGYYGYIFLYTASSGLYDHSYFDFIGLPSQISNQKSLGPPCNCAGDPINLGTGNEYRDENDASLGALSFHRYYNSNAAVTSSHIGMNWRHNFDRSLQYLQNGSFAGVTILRPDGRVLFFTLQGSQWVADLDVADRLTEQTDASGNPSAWTYFVAATRNLESYDANGNLVSIATPDGQVTTLTYSISSTPASVAPRAGLLLMVTDPRGRSLNFTYNTQGNITTVTMPDTGVLTYGYDGIGNLNKVTYPDTTYKQYVYNESALTSGVSQPNALTGDIDETQTRLTSIGYDAQGRATMSRLGTSVELTQVSYGSNAATVTYPTGAQATLNFATINNSIHTSAVSAACGYDCGQPNVAATFDTNGYPASTTDFSGNLTTTTYDNDGLLHVEVDASGTSIQRTITTGWDDVNRVPLTRTVQNASGSAVASTSWVYNTLGQPLARCELDPTNSAAASYTCAATGTVPAGVRRWTYTYCTAVNTTQCPLIGLLLTSTGPRTDLSQTATYSYYTTSSATNCGTPGSACYQAGDPYQITDALGHVTTYASYDGAGRVTRITDPNGVNTDMTYTPRGWLASRTVGGSTTTFTYMPYGEVQTVTDPDGVVTTFGYDTAHRLTDITDAQGNDIHYTLDAAGNKTAEQISTASGTVVHSLSRSYNALGQLTAVIDGLNQTVFNAGYSDSYDANGNLTHSADGRSIQRQQSYDALNRLVSTLDNYNGTDTATANTTTTTSLDALDRVTSVTDPSNLVTSYTHDGLSNLTALQSPDSGASSSTFDAAGNALTHTDAKGIVATSTYDALNRKTSTSYMDTTANVTYTYDEANSVTGCTASAPIGRLTRMVENAVSTTYCYDARGNVIQKTQVVSGTTDSTSYSYTAADRLSGETTPDGTVISYAFNSSGRISGVQVTPSGSTSASPTVVSSVTWLPFGPISGYTLGNGQVVTRTYDANYRLTDLTSPALALHFSLDAMGDITALGNAPGANPATESYQYDPLYRLTSVTNSGGVLESYTYNQTGDRLSKTASGLATGTYSYTSGTHQLASIGSAPRANDANGNTTGSVIGGQTYGFAYDSRQRIALAQANGATVGTYLYNALGQRVYTSATSLRFDYDQAGHVLANYGASSRDYVWLDDLPVALVDNTTSGGVMSSTVNYVIADGLNTPRVVINGADTPIWGWAYQGNPFGEKQPTSTGYVLNLRFPGQWYDAETGTMDNHHRTYEPVAGRYLQNDPIGLNGGISTYAYVDSSPLNGIDQSGLCLTSADCVCLQNLELCAEIWGTIAQGEAGIQKKLGNDCAAKAWDAAEEDFETLGRIAPWIPLVGGVKEVAAAAAEATSAAGAVKAAASAAAAKGLDWAADKGADAAGNWLGGNLNSWGTGNGWNWGSGGEGATQSVSGSAGGVGGPSKGRSPAPPRISAGE